MKTKKSFRFSLRSKLFVLSLTFLLVPYVAYRSLVELENSLRFRLEDTLLEVGNSIAAFLSDREELLRHDVSNDNDYIFVHDLKYPILLDGYGDEWSELLPWAHRYESEQSNDFSYRLMFGRYDNSLYILIDVKDSTQTYHNPSQSTVKNSDHVSMVVKNIDDDPITYELAPEAPGKFFPFILEPYWLQEQDIGLTEPEYRKIYLTNIQAYWQRTKQGYTVELEVPWNIAPNYLGFIVHDAISTELEPISIASFAEETNNGLSQLIQQSKELNTIIRSLGVTKNRRVWILDTIGQVIAVDGSLKAKLKKAPVNLLYEILLPKTYERFNDELSEASRLEGKEIQAALNGRADSRWRASNDDKAVILSAAAPIIQNGLVKGIVVVEETTNSIQLLKRDALTNLINKTLIIFIAITAVILFFASYLSFRLRKLSQQADQAIDEHGRVVGDITLKESNDELGELVANYKKILSRLKQYHDYLESMASKLSHELRTPITVVQSSLDNFEQEIDKEKQQEYLERANQGIEQLNHIISRLSEATRLENILTDSEKESVDIVKLIEDCVSAYKDAYSPVNIDFSASIDKQIVKAVPDLIVQMLDKLIQNAVDFHTAGTTIQFIISDTEKELLIDVINKGPTLSDEIETQLFQSMTTHRSKTNNGQPHLGLGLYIVRMIVEFHFGSVKASNLSDQSGVKFSISLAKT